MLLDSSEGINRERLQTVAEYLQCYWAPVKWGQQGTSPSSCWELTVLLGSSEVGPTGNFSRQLLCTHSVIGLQCQVGGFFIQVEDGDDEVLLQRVARAVRHLHGDGVVVLLLVVQSRTCR